MSQFRVDVGYRSCRSTAPATVRRFGILGIGPVKAQLFSPKPPILLGSPYSHGRGQYVRR